MSMYRMIVPSALRTRLRLAIVTVFICALPGCAGMNDFWNRPLPLAGYPDDRIERNDFSVAPGEDVVGRLAAIRLQKDDTLPDVARHFSLGLNTVTAANPDVDVWVPRAGERVLLPLSFILPEGRRRGIVINLAAMRLFHYKAGDNGLAVSTYPVGVGTAERPSPLGKMYITRKKYRPTWYVPASIAADHRQKGDPLPPQVPPGPLNPLGEHALYLSAAGSYLIHGTNKPASIGLRATNGCIRLYPEDIERLFEITRVKTPVRIVNQPYLVGRRDGIVYVEAHPPFGKSGVPAMKRTFARLRKIEQDTGRALDWNKVEQALAERRGYPVPVSELSLGRELTMVRALNVRHPGKLYGRPEVPDLETNAWYVLAAILHDKVDARRLAAIINHQGPPIPARVVSKGARHRVLAGPFSDRRAAQKAVKRLKIDLALDGILVET